MKTQARSHFFSIFANIVSEWAGRPAAFVAAFTLILLWAVAGPFFHYSENWQLVVNTATTIITFLMVFVVQNSQNRDGKALQAKLDELILSSRDENRFIGAESLAEEELRELSDELHEKAKLSDEALLEKQKQKQKAVKT